MNGSPTYWLKGNMKAIQAIQYSEAIHLLICTLKISFIVTQVFIQSKHNNNHDRNSCF